MIAIESTSIRSRATPSLLSSDLARTRSFYEALGFSITGHWGQPAPEWMELAMGAMVLQFYTEPPEGTLRAPAMSGVLYFEVDDPDTLAGAFASHTELAWGPEEMDYGQREFAIRDPDGYLLAFYAPTPDASPTG